MLTEANGSWFDLVIEENFFLYDLILEIVLNYYEAIGLAFILSDDIERFIELEVFIGHS